MSVRIALADDHAILLDGVRSALEKAGLRVIGTVRDGRDAVNLAREQRPDVILMDVSMPGMNGIEATRRITKGTPDVRVLCLSMHDELQFVTAALDAGASGYVLKEQGVQELVEAIRAVMKGHTYLGPGIRDKVSRANTGVSELTNREREVLQLVAEGYTNVEIATRLGVSAKTVSTHRQSVMDKLDIHNVAGLTRYAVRHGLASSEYGGNGFAVRRKALE
ncbi:MAG: response regulator [Acidobacteria bacterium]|nr:response regulator [Acidobacteriota bacterium]NIM63230.1 response regulator [Acidobacteriota bacterium]NIO61008.1 response regulator [Acidobacteriota bacterium]NIQ87517.1 response regulator [Acidobacteriota bacterium]NIT12645.1 response regulator [Acidobacteriota bacterium]